LRAAVDDLSLLLTRGYAHFSATKLVGDHYQLAARQRTAIGRSACPDQARAYRLEHNVPVPELAQAPITIDGYNLLIGTESALGHAVLIRGRDQTIRDMASVHGSYRRVHETLPAIELIGRALVSLRVDRVHWLLDAPVANSARLKQMLTQHARDNQWPWHITLSHHVDTDLAQSDGIVITSDGPVLDKVDRWANLLAWLITQPEIHRHDIVELG